MKSYFIRWKELKERNNERYFLSLLANEWAELFDDLISDNRIFLNLIFKNSKHEYFFNTIIMLIKDYNPKFIPNLEKALEGLLSKYKYEQMHDSLETLLVIMDTFDIKIDYYFLEFLITDKNIPKNLRIKVAKIYSLYSDNQAISFWEKLNYDNFDYIFPFYLIFLSERNPIKALRTLNEIKIIPENTYSYIYPLRKIFVNIFAFQEKFLANIIDTLPYVPKVFKDLIFNKVLKYNEFKLYEAQLYYDIAYNELWIYDLSKNTISNNDWQIEINQILYGKRNNIIQKYKSVLEYINHLIENGKSKSESKEFFSEGLKEYIPNFKINYETISRINIIYLIDFVGSSYKLENLKVLLDLTKNLIEDFRLFNLKKYDSILEKSLQSIRSYFPSIIIYNKSNIKKFPEFKIYLKLLSEIVIRNKELSSTFIKELLEYGYIDKFKKKYLEIIVENIAEIIPYLLNKNKLEIIINIVYEVSKVYGEDYVIKIFQLIKEEGGDFEPKAQFQKLILETPSLSYKLSYKEESCDIFVKDEALVIYLLKNFSNDTNYLINEKLQSIN